MMEDPVRNPTLEEMLECTICDWRGVEREAIEDSAEDDLEYRCPDCGEPCAHLPLDEEAR